MDNDFNPMINDLLNWKDRIGLSNWGQRIREKLEKYELWTPIRHETRSATQLKNAQDALTERFLREIRRGPQQLE